MGESFTWSRGWIEERLDRAVCNSRWNILFPHVGVLNGEMTKSDHRPLVVNTEFYAEQSRPRGAKRRFEARWLKEKIFSNIVMDAWTAAGVEHGMASLSQKLNMMHSTFHDWDQ